MPVPCSASTSATSTTTVHIRGSPTSAQPRSGRGRRDRRTGTAKTSPRRHGQPVLTSRVTRSPEPQARGMRRVLAPYRLHALRDKTYSAYYVLVLHRVLPRVRPTPPRSARRERTGSGD